MKADGVSRAMLTAARIRDVRRWSALVVILLLTLAVGAVPGDRVRAEPGYPTLLVWETGSAIAVSPALPTGRYVVMYQNDGPGPNEIVLARLPPDLSLRAALSAPDVTSIPWWLDVTYVGGPGAAAPGARAQSIVDLLPGEYVAFTADAERPVATIRIAWRRASW